MPELKERVETERKHLLDSQKAAKNAQANYSDASNAVIQEPSVANKNLLDIAMQKLTDANEVRDNAQDLFFDLQGQLAQHLLDAVTKVETTAEDERKRMEADQKERLKRLTEIAESREKTGSGVQGGQLNVIPVFSGEGKYDVEGWLDLVERAQTQFSWTDRQVTAIVKNKLTGSAAIWMRATEKLAPQGFDSWVLQDDAFKKKFTDKFLPARTEQGAVTAIMNLHQKTGEGVSAFYDRVILAVDKVNHNVSDEEKKTNAYQKGFHSQIMTFFAAGMRQQIREVVLGSNSPPLTMEALHTQAVATELQLSTKLQTVKELVEVSQVEEEAKKPEAKASPENNELKEIMKKLEALSTQKKRDLSKVTCYCCRQKGHLATTCSQRTRGGGARGRGGMQRGNGGFRGRGSGQGNRGRRGNWGHYNGGYQNFDRRSDEFFMDHQPQYQPQYHGFQGQDQGN